MRTATVSVANVQQVRGELRTESLTRSSSQQPHGSVVLLSMSIVAVVAVVMWFVLSTWAKPHIIHIATGYIPLAGIVAITAALERFLEPISNIWNPPAAQATLRNRARSASAKSAAATATADANKAVIDPDSSQALKNQLRHAADTANDRAKAVAVPPTAAQAHALAVQAANNPRMSDTEVVPLVQRAADMQAKLRADRTVFYWALASSCGLGIAGGFGFLLLQAVSSSNVNRFLDLAVTGLTIGAGTKPLHDLITGIQSK